MRVVSNFLRLAASAMLCVGLALSGCAGVETAPASPSLKQRIEAAHTRADHMVLEAYYNGEAKTARAKASEHRDMIQAYLKQVTDGHGNANMETHCNSLIKGYESIAVDYEMLAAGHLQKAEQAKP